MIVNENELQVFNHGFQKRTVKLHQSRFYCYTREPIDLLTKQLRLVDKRQLCTRPNYVDKSNNAVYCGLGMEVYLVVRELVEKKRCADIHWCEEAADGKQFFVKFLRAPSAPSSSNIPQRLRKDEKSSLLKMECAVERLLSVFDETKEVSWGATNRWRVRLFHTLSAAAATEAPHD